jgi:transcription elongation factor Elf1
MSAFKVNRLSLSELDEITFRCKSCGGGHIVKMDSERFGAAQCPSCGAPYETPARAVFESLQDAHKYAKGAAKYFEVEFNQVEK